MRKIGILTGGGDAPGLNAVLRAVVLCASNEVHVEIVGIRDGFGGFAEGDEGVVPLARDTVRGLLWRGG
ncbi:6-phosphofructokinase, partial [Myxococcota bacterium]|nr:6-phosphofructokinase [Myxococcota bacterium]